MTVLLLTLGFIALMTTFAVVPGLLWSDAPDRRGEVRHLRTVRVDDDDEQLAA